MRTPSSLRAWAPTLAFVVALALSGCFGGPAGDRAADGTDREEDVAAEDIAFGTLYLEIVGFERPEGATNDPVPVTFTLDHLGLLHEDTDDWVATLAAPTSVALELTETVSDVGDLGAFPVPAGTYSAVEALASAATIDPGDGEESATVADTTCFATVGFTVPEDGEATLTLVLSGPDAFVRSGGWTFQPALTGALTEDGDGGFGEPNCA